MPKQHELYCFAEKSIMIELLRTRRSIRKFTEQKIEENHRQLLEEALLRSPSSKSIDPWEFFFIDDPALIESLSRCKPHGANPLKTAPLAIVITADETKNDVWEEDCSVASILVQLEAHALGLGSCWVQVRKRMHDESISSEKYVQQLLSIPEKYRVLSVIAVGHPAQQREGKPAEELDFGKIHRNRF